MAQILSIYGLVTAIMMSNGIKEKMPIHTGFLMLGAGIAVGLCGLAAGFAIGIVGDAGGMFFLLFHPFFSSALQYTNRLYEIVRASTQQPRLYVGLVLILIFAEVLGLYGVVVSVLMISKANNNVTVCQY